MVGCSMTGDCRFVPQRRALVKGKKNGPGRWQTASYMSTSGHCPKILFCTTESVFSPFTTWFRKKFTRIPVARHGQTRTFYSTPTHFPILHIRAKALTMLLVTRPVRDAFERLKQRVYRRRATRAALTRLCQSTEM